MPIPHTELFVHAVWATSDRLPLVTADLEPQVYGAIEAHCRLLNTTPLALGGTEEHVHLLVRLPPRLAVASLVEAVKAASAELVTQRLRPGRLFEWGATYGAFTLGQDAVPRAIQYVRSQKSLHATQNVWDAWERYEAPGKGTRPLQRE